MSPIAHPAHTRNEKTTDSWITPKWIIEKLGPFDIDPCACDQMPWTTATRMITQAEDGLKAEWNGFVWMNPPYGRQLGTWLEKLSRHNNGIALVFARMDTDAFHQNVFGCASSLLFIKGRITFCTPDGEQASYNSGGPNVLIGYGDKADQRLLNAHDIGAFMKIRRINK